MYFVSQAPVYCHVWYAGKKGKKSATQLCHTMAVPSAITGPPNKKTSETLAVSARVYSGYWMFLNNTEHWW